MEGRDICTYVFPKADVKIYLDATLEERANRRFKEFQERGIDTTYEEVKAAIAARDYNDMNKEIGSLKVTDESVVVDSTNMEIEEVVNRVVEIIKEKTS